MPTIFAPQRLSPCVVLIVVIVAAAVANNTRAAESAPDEVQFNRDVRPILADKCFACHGPDEGQRQAELRFDLQEEALADRDGAPAIAPGKPDQSELFRRITAEDADERMPPADFGKTLSGREIDILRRWIEQGAAWQQHWSLIPPVRPAFPGQADAKAGEHAIDRFIDTRLDREKLARSPAADRRTLIRRLSFDLLGLPPAPEDVEAFVTDVSPRAYENLVDRLLASEKFGERMAAHWLDLVRYADTNGIHGDNHREHWLYRDYVIAAFNDNKPFDTFTIEQLAGDLLAGATREQQIASGYNRLNMTTREGGAQAKEYRAKYDADRVRNASSVWLGATLGCAECHDHKFDPYTQRDFYSFAAFFADLQETPVGVQQPRRFPTAEQAAQIEELERQLAEVKRVLDTQTPELDTSLAKWEEELKTRRVEWTVLRPSSASSEGGATLTVHDNGTITAGGARPDKDVYSIEAECGLKAITAIRVDLLPDDSLPAKGPGRAGNGNLVLSELELSAGGEKLELANATSTHSQDGWPVTAAIDGKATTGWAVLPQTGRENQAVFETKSDIELSERKTLTLRLSQQHGGAHTLGRFRLQATSATRPVRADGAGVPEKIAAILAVGQKSRSGAQKNDLAAHYRTIAPELAPQRKKVQEIEKQKKAAEDKAPQLLMSVSVEPREMRILPRGNWLDDSGDVVAPAVPQSLGELAIGEGRATRLDLARWFVDPENPAAARVFVNRLWDLYFGRGLVKSLDDFGVQGEWPAHLDLLDWLAVEFIESGWDVKHMVKLIVTSQTYRQSSLASQELREADPYNRLFARQGRFRLDAEMVRDNALAVSGLLVERVGGPSVKPYQPSGYWSHLNFPKRVYKHDAGDSQYRRGLYTYWCRTFLHPSMLAFDAPTREECAASRPRSNTPLAALVLLNDPTYVEAARALAERAVRTGGEGAEAKVAFLFDAVLARKPAEEETKLLASIFANHQRQYQQEPESAKEALTVGLRPAPEDVDAAKLAAWMSVARVMLNLHETITRR